VLVFEEIPRNYSFTKAVVTVGMYDGVHLAHKLILQRVCNLAKSMGGQSILVTFEPHPRLILYPEQKIAMLSSRQEKIALLEEIGIDVLIFIPFSIEFSKMSSFEFVKSIIVDAIHAHKIVVGYNHYFGHNREGNFAHLSKLGAQFGFEVEEILEQDIQNESVSSSKIREALASGDMMKANAYLDYEYQISATLKKGNTMFSNLGYHGWNVKINFKYKLIPAEGLYFVNTTINQQIYKAVLWISCADNDEKNIQLLIIDYKAVSETVDATIVFKHLVRFCNKNILPESLKKSIDALIFQANL